jgi:uncharacterized protein (DUF1778 family)
MSPQVKEASPPVVRIDARIPAHIKESLVIAAALQGTTQTDFLIAAVNEAAKRVIAEHNVIRFCLEDQKTLAKALLDEHPSPNPGTGRLRQALEDHTRSVESI